MSYLSNEAKKRLFGIEIDNLTREEAIEKIKNLLCRKVKGFIVTPNAAHIVELRKDREFFDAYRNAIMILPDGISLIVASRLLGNPLKERCSGADLFPEICRLAWELGKSVFILGGERGSEKIVEEKLKQTFPGIILKTLSPPFGFEKEEKITDEIISEINNFPTDILLVCVGTPKSEKWIFKNFSKLEIILAFSLGSSPDFFAGIKKRAPKCIQKIGFEWLWRLIHEPGRLWKRYLLGNTIFIWIVVKELIKKTFKKKSYA